MSRFKTVSRNNTTSRDEQYRRDTATQDLGKQLAAAMDPAKAAQLRRKLRRRIMRRLMWRYRRQWTPLALLAITWISGILLHHVDHGVRTTLVLGSAATIGMWYLSRRWLQRREDRVLAIGYTAGLVIWLSVAAAVGTGHPMPTLLLIGGIIGAVPWWRRHAIRIGQTSQGDEALITTWDELVANEGGVLPGSYLFDVEKIRKGWRATIQLRPGKQETTDAITALGKITSAYNASMGCVTLEAMPDGNASRASLLVLEENPLTEPQLWTGPAIDITTGVAPIGIYADDTPALWRWWMPKSGAVHGLVSGTTGSGKSRLLDLLIASSAHCGLIVPWIIDPQNGQSVPDWITNVDWAATNHEQSKQMLRSAVAIMDDRSQRFAVQPWTDDKGRSRNGKPWFDPTPETPLLHIWIEEAHEVLRDEEALLLVERIAKLGRKTGIGLTLVTQVPSVSELGGSAVVREMLASGNIAVFRTASRMTGQMAFQGILPVEPHTLPREFPDGTSTGGLGFVLGPSARTAPQRSFYVEDPYHWATSAVLPQLEQAAQLAGGVAYATRSDPITEKEADNTGLSIREPVQPIQRDISSSEAVLVALTELGGQAERGAIMHHIGRHTKFSPRAITDALKKLVDNGHIEKTARGLYTLPNT